MAEQSYPEGALFPPSRSESAGWLRAFINRERAHRVGMLQRHPDKREYWQGKVAECDEAQRHIDNLKEA